VTVLEFGALPTAAGAGTVTVQGPFGSFRGEHLAEELAVLIDPDGDRPVRVLGRYTSGRATGTPALTARATGAGTAYYLATIPDDEGMRDLVGWLCGEAGVEPVLPSAGPWVEASRRGDVLTVINHGTETVEVDVAGTDLVTGLPVESLRLEQYSWALVTTSGAQS